MSFAQCCFIPVIIALCLVAVYGNPDPDPDYGSYGGLPFEKDEWGDSDDGQFANFGDNKPIAEVLEGRSAPLPPRELVFEDNRRQLARDSLVDCCPTGWMAYGYSCVLYVREKMPFITAQQFCYQKKATLFVVNSLHEWESIRQHFQSLKWSWIGLRVKSSIPPVVPIWQTGVNGVNPETLPWLNKQNGHGWISGNDCVAYYGGEGTASYVHYYPCGYSYYFACERNMTAAVVSRRKQFQRRRLEAQRERQQQLLQQQRQYRPEAANGDPITPTQATITQQQQQQQLQPHSQQFRRGGFQGGVAGVRRNGQ